MGRQNQVARDSTVARRAFGRLLSQLRQRAGLTVSSAAVLLNQSRATIYRYEGGAVGAKDIDIQAICDVYSATEPEASLLLGLITDSRTASGWWVPNATVPGYNLCAEVEQLAGGVRCFGATTVPTLLRTVAYHTAVGGTSGGGPELAHRQTVLTRPFNPLRLDAVLAEASLRCPVGGPLVMADQLTRLLELGSQPHMSLRVVPTKAGTHPGLTAGSFEIMDFKARVGTRPPDPTTVHIEGHLGALYYDALAFPTEVGVYESAFKEINALALGAEASRQLIADIERELRIHTDNREEPSWPARWRP